MILPMWGKVLSLFFPLTYSLGVLRKVFIKSELGFLEIGLMVGVNLMLVLLTGVLVFYVERKFRRTGEFNLYFLVLFEF